MEFGKLETLDGVDFTLPPDPPENARLLAALPPRAGKPKIWLGSTGWSMKEWVGSFYPQRAKTTDFLKFYAQQFNCIEANTTFYKVPDAAAVENWVASTPDDFRFCPKVPKSISHLQDFSQIGTELPLFIEAMRLLGGRLGVVFLQLGPYFSPDRLPSLARFLKNWPHDLPLAIEVRHEGFFSKKPDGKLLSEAGEYFQMLENQGIATCISDVAGRRDVAFPRLTTNKMLIRFVSNGLHPTDFARADDWADRLADWLAKGLPEIYFFAHAPDNLLSPEMAIILSEKFQSAIPGLDIRGPKPIVKTAVQGSLF